MMTMMMTIVHVDRFWDPKCTWCACSLGPWRITTAIRSQHPKASSWPHTVDLVVQAFWRNCPKSLVLVPFEQGLPQPIEHDGQARAIWLQMWQSSQNDQESGLYHHLFSRKDLGECLFLRYHAHEPGHNPHFAFELVLFVEQLFERFLPQNFLNFLFGRRFRKKIAALPLWPNEKTAALVIHQAVG